MNANQRNHSVTLGLGDDLVHLTEANDAHGAAQMSAKNARIDERAGLGPEASARAKVGSESGVSAARASAKETP